MAVAEKAVAYIEMEDYLVLENASRYKHEYLAGVIYAVQGDGTRGMAGGSAVHADLIRNMGFALHQRLRGTPCSVKMTEMRLRVKMPPTFETKPGDRLGLNIDIEGLHFFAPDTEQRIV